MNQEKKIPAWAVGMILTVVGVLFTVAGGLGTYIFTSLVTKVDRIDDRVSDLRQAVTALDARVDTQQKAFVNYKK